MTADVVVLGSGAAGLTAALAAADSGASVTVLEKSGQLGGTTALSSGVVWLPVHALHPATSGGGARVAALDYLESLSVGMTRRALLEAFVDASADLVDWLHSRSQVRLRVVEGFPDYHPENPGGLPEGGRSLEPELVRTTRIGTWASNICGVPRRMLVAETPTGGGAGFIPDDELHRRRAEGVEGLGRALVVALLSDCLERGVEVRTSTPASRLAIEGGRVVGVHTDSGELVGARRGVVLATGGFEQDPDLARAFLRGPMDEPPGAATNTGDGLRMAMRAGAALGNMREAWWVPLTRLPEGDSYGGRGLHLVLRERTLPRSIIVNSAGRRFANEAGNYNALGGAFHQLDPARFAYANLPCWLLVDEEFVRRYGGFGAPVGAPLPSIAQAYDDVEALAHGIGAPPDALAGTIRRWNIHAARMEDPDFGRGRSAYDGWCGDQTQYPSPAATIGPLDEPPYYAIPLISSALGTSGGPLTDAAGAVLGLDGDVIPGLFAAGNVMAAPTGMAYGGAGGTLGPAMTFGMLAGRAAASSAR